MPCFPRPVPGRFRVDEDACTCCATCGSVAPAHFDEGERTYVVFAQPETAAEVAACRDALDACPFDAIREDQGSVGGTTTV